MALLGEIKCFKKYMARGSEKRKMDRGGGESYTHHLTVGYTQPMNEVRS